MAGGETVLVTGAGGFIGGRIVEMLHLGGAYRVRAGIHNWQSAARIGRFPIEIVPCDILDPTSIRRALEGVRYVVHCAYGDRTTTVDGTNNMLSGALLERVERFVHMSTVEVYGDVAGDVSESQPCGYTGSPYGDSKIDAENVCWVHREKGLPVTVLRPTIVYGPFSKVWTVGVAERLRSERFAGVRKYANGRCNLLYIDDLAAMVEISLSHAGSVGEAFNVNGSERPTWNAYFGAFHEAMGRGSLRESQTGLALAARAVAPARTVAKLALARYEAPIMKLYANSKWAQRAIRKAERLIKSTPTVAELGLYGREALFDTAKASSMVGYSPRYDMAEGLKMSIRWLKHEGLLELADPDPRAPGA